MLGIVFVYKTGPQYKVRVRALACIMAARWGALIKGKHLVCRALLFCDQHGQRWRAPVVRDGKQVILALTSSICLPLKIYRNAHPHAGRDSSLHLVQLVHGRVDGHRYHGVVQHWTRPPLIADGLLGHEVVGQQRGLAIPSAKHLVIECRKRSRNTGGGGEGADRVTFNKPPRGGRVLVYSRHSAQSYDPSWLGSQAGD